MTSSAQTQPETVHARRSFQGRLVLIASVILVAWIGYAVYESYDSAKSEKKLVGYWRFSNGVDEPYTDAELLADGGVRHRAPGSSEYGPTFYGWSVRGERLRFISANVGWRNQVDNLWARVRNQPVPGYIDFYDIEFVDENRIVLKPQSTPAGDESICMQRIDLNTQPLPANEMFDDPPPVEESSLDDVATE